MSVTRRRSALDRPSSPRSVLWHGGDLTGPTRPPGLRALRAAPAAPLDPVPGPWGRGRYPALRSAGDPML